jgi:hypothetical protein
MGVCSSFGRAVAQAVSRRLSTAATRVRERVKSCGICCRQSGISASFLLVLPLIHPLIAHRLSTRASAMG